MTTTNTTTNVAHDAGRIPLYNGDVRAWATAMHERGLAYHIDDDAFDIVVGASGDRTFTDVEAAAVTLIVAQFDADQRELYFDTVLELHSGEQSSPAVEVLNEKFGEVSK